MPKVLVSDPIAPEGIEILQRVADVDVKTGLPKEELAAIIGDYDALAVRSETKVTADIIAAARNLKIIGRAGVGVDNIDVEAATKRGILVVNSPEGNTVAAAELTVAMLLALARNIPQADLPCAAASGNGPNTWGPRSTTRPSASSASARSAAKSRSGSSRLK